MVLPAAPPPAGALLGTVAVACLGSVNFGYTLGWTSPNELAMLNATALPAAAASQMAAVVNVGAGFGAVLGAVLVERAGRRAALGISALPGVLGWVLVAIAPVSRCAPPTAPSPSGGSRTSARSLGGAFACLMAGRCLCGVSIGVTTFGTPLLINEVSPTAIRGGLGACNQVLIVVGVVLSYAVGAGLDRMARSALPFGLDSWRCAAAVGASIPLLLGIGAPFIAESPRWLLQRRSAAKARATMRRLRGSTPAALELADAELEAMVQSNRRTEAAEPPSLAAALFERPVLLAVGIQVLVQAGGINALTFYAAPIFEQTGETHGGANTLA